VVDSRAASRLGGVALDSEFYTTVFYPLQDKVLAVIGQAETDFYLSGGTAASRGYLSHRFSDDLDLFVNDRKEFSLWAGRVVQSVAAKGEWTTRVLLQEERFARFVVSIGDIDLKVEMINDVPAHCGAITQHPVLGRLDSPENILANKVSAALDRQEPKDLADIWGFCRITGLSLKEAIENADSKAAGVFPADLARLLCSVTEADHGVIRWQNPPAPDGYCADLIELGESLILTS
jgi:hypothetical protein